MKTKYSLMLFILLFPVFVYAQQGNTMSSHWKWELLVLILNILIQKIRRILRITMDRFIMISSISLY